jgi:hypothetical protein
MVTDLTGMEVANASLLDEGTAAGEAMTLLHRVQAKRMGDDGGVMLVSDRVFPHTIEVLRSRAEPLGIELRVQSPSAMTFDARTFGVLLQYPDEGGRIDDLRAFITTAHDGGALVAVATDLRARSGDAARRWARTSSSATRSASVNRSAAAVRTALRGERRLVAHAGPHHRRVWGRAGKSAYRMALPGSISAARGDVGHLHRAGATGEHGCDVRRVSRAERPAGDRHARARLHTDPRHRTAKPWLPATERRVLRHTASDRRS